MRHGRSGTSGFGLSGTQDTDFRERLVSAKPQKSSPNRASSNCANRKESFGFLLTARAAVDSLPAFRAPALCQQIAWWYRAGPLAANFPGEPR